MVVVEASGPSDTQLVRQAILGNTGAFDVLVDRYHRSLFSLAYRMLGNTDDAADAVQEAFVKAFRALREFQPDRPLRPWLYKICANVAIDLGRARSKAPDPLEEHDYAISDGQPAPEEIAIAKDRDRQVHAAVARLPEKYRQIVVLRHFQHMEVNEIADVMDAPEGTVKSWLFRARAMLRRELACLQNNPIPTEELAK